MILMCWLVCVKSNDIALMFLSDRLRNKFIAPKISLTATTDADKSKSKKSKSSKEPIISKTEAVILTQGLNDAVIVNYHDAGIASTPMPNNSATLMTAANLIDLSKETMIYSFLGVRVKMGDTMVPSTRATGKTSVSYETIIRILPFTEVEYGERDKIDEEAYSSMQVSSKPISIVKDFEGYEALCNELERKGVYCRNRVPKTMQGGNNNGNEHHKHHHGHHPHDKNKKKSSKHSLVILNVAFPRTYRKSSFGWKLSDKQYQTR